MPTTPTDQDDVLQDTSGNDNLDGLGGDDVITVTGGTDIVAGGGGSDRLVIDWRAFGGYGTFYTSNFQGSLATGYSGTYSYYTERGSGSVTFSGIEHFSIATPPGLATQATQRGFAQVTTGDGNDIISTTNGNDSIAPGGGTDSVSGGMWRSTDSPFGPPLYGPPPNPGGNGVAYGSGSVAVIVNLSSRSYVVGAGHTHAGTVLPSGSAIDYTGSIDRFSSIQHAAGGSADDLFIDGPDANVFSGGAGTDTVDYSIEDGPLGIRVNLTDQFTGIFAHTASGSRGGGHDRLNSIENIRSGARDDEMWGDASANRFETGGGNDRAYGGGGDDVLIGGDGDDRLDGQTGDDVVEGGNGDDRVAAGAQATGTDRISGGPGFDTLELSFVLSESPVWNGMATAADPGGGYAGQMINTASDRLVTFTSVEKFSIVGSRFNDVIAGAANDDQLDGGEGADQLYGGSGADVLTGGLGIDTTDGGPGNDTHVVDDAGDIVVERLGEGIDSVTAAVDYVIPANVEDLRASAAAGTAALSLTGNALANRIYGTNGNNVLDGAVGADTLVGYGGNDIYYVDEAGDLIVEDSAGGTDTVMTIADYVLGDHVEHLQAKDPGGIAPLKLTGNALSNIIYGNRGDNVLNGASGADFMIGNGGNDLYYVDDTGDAAYEEANGGDDTVATAADYTLGANVENLQANDISGTAPLALTGNMLDNIIWGTQGNNILNGAGGADVMVGYAGNDVYYVGDPGDIAYELVDGGTDTAITTVSFALGANVENLQANDIGGTAALSLTGNSLNNQIYATQGNNVLNGAGGADVMVGYAGNDIYYVDDRGDVAYEMENGGNDLVLTTISFTLGDHVENLQANDIGGTAPLTLTGNALANTIYGTQGSNILNGAGGADFMVGYGGSDLYHVDHATDVAYEETNGGSDIVVTSASYTLGANLENLQASDIGGTAPLALTGNDVANFIWGTNGDNLIAGRGGMDRLYGYGGADRFLFDTAPEAGGHDYLDDFQPGVDKILLDNSVFAALADGALPASAFVNGAAAADADDRIIFNPLNGGIFYDADGSGAGAAVLIAIVQSGQTLTAGDFTVI